MPMLAEPHGMLMLNEPHPPTLRTHAVLGTVVAASIIEKAGRKQLLVNSYLGQAAAMLLMAFGFASPALSQYAAPIAVVGTLLYIVTFALGAGPVTGLLVPELCAASIRGVDMFAGCMQLLERYAACLGVSKQVQWQAVKGCCNAQGRNVFEWLPCMNGGFAHAFCGVLVVALASLNRALVRLV
eukprot:725586-Pelagomonas_calceolata.AAC.7